MSNFADEADAKTLLAFWQWIWDEKADTTMPNEADVWAFLAERRDKREAEYHG